MLELKQIVSMSVEFYRKKGKRSKNAPPPTDSDSEEDRDVNAAAYKQAELDAALTRREDYVRSTQELKEVLGCVYGRAAKSAQSCMVEDVKIAIKNCDGSAFQSKALSELVAVAEHTLPKTKREAVQREYKQAQVELHRSLKKAAKSREEEELAPADLPEHVLSQILERLDPFNLARAACVSRTWRALSRDERLWSRYVPSPPPHWHHRCPATCLQRFRESGRLKQRWQSRRVVTADGKLAWQSAATAPGETAPACYPISIAMVVSCILGCRQLASDSSDSDSEEEEPSARAFGRLWATAVRLDLTDR